LLALQTPQRAYLDPAHRMHARRPVLETPHMHEPALQIDLIPAERAQLRRPQPMPVRDEDHRRVAMTIPPARPRAFDELPHFLDGEIFARPALRIQKPPRGHCPDYSVRSGLALAAFRG
jgi:hypothetical protein